MAGIGFYGTGIAYPGGAPASNQAIIVVLEGTDTPADLFNDVEGTIPLVNPIATDNYGNISFFAEEGVYELLIRGSRTRIFIQGTEGEPGPPGVAGGIEYVQSVPSASWSFDVPEELGRTPNVSVYVDGQFVLADVYADSSTVNVHQPFPMTGSVVLS